MAVIQARSVIDRLAKRHPDIQFILYQIKTKGDTNKSLSMDEIPGTGIFVSEVQSALLANKIDIAVHSLKDLPVLPPKDLTVAAVIRRLDHRDVLVSHGMRLKELPLNSVIGTGSQRRAAQLLDFRSDLKIQSIRGNIHTRLQKITLGEVDGVVLAAAAMIRLGLKAQITEYLSPAHFLPAPGQGSLAVEVRRDDRDMKRIVLPLNHEVSRQCVMAERAFLLEVGGGCTAPVACLGRVNGDTITLRGMIGKANRLFCAKQEGTISSYKEVANALAKKLAKMEAVFP